MINIFGPGLPLSHLASYIKEFFGFDTEVLSNHLEAFLTAFKNSVPNNIGNPDWLARLGNEVIMYLLGYDPAYVLYLRMCRFYLQLSSSCCVRITTVLYLHVPLVP